MITQEAKSIQVSYDYDAFKFIRGNRQIDKVKVKNYVDMINDGYSHDECPILVTKDMEILDGQHRFLAAKEKGTPIYYIISSKTSSSNAMIDINKNTSNWTLLDYCACYSERGNEHYKKLLDFMKKNKVSVGVAMICLGYSKKST